jgi:hypothetical protein
MFLKFSLTLVSKMAGAAGAALAPEPGARTDEVSGP